MKKAEKLNDVSLAEVSAGITGYGVALAAGAGTAVLGGLTDFSCSLASLACQHRAKANRKNGNTERAEKLEKSGRVLTDISFASKPVALAGAVVALGTIACGHVNGLDTVVKLSDELTPATVDKAYSSGWKSLLCG